MSTVTPNLGLVKPTTLEQFALSVLNNNMDTIDAAAMQVDMVNSAGNGAIDYRGCRFTRVRTGNVGIIVVEIIVTFGVTAIPSNTAATLDVAGAVPSGYRPVSHTSIPVQAALTSNAGVGQGIGFAIKDNGVIGVRSQGAAFSTTSGSQTYAGYVYRWDGVL